MASGDTIAAIATAPGRGGVAVVRVSGPDSFAVARKLTRDDKLGARISERGMSVKKLYSPSAISGSTSSPAPLDEALVLCFHAPRSYTGEDVVEFQCHGGTVTPRRVLEACFAAGARLARRGEFTQRAFLNGRIDSDQAEAVIDLIDAKTARAADAALAGLSGSRQRELRALYESALDLSVKIEHALDISEEELPEGFQSEIDSAVEALRVALSAAIRRAHEGKLLREGALVVLAGPPNAGKSSLMNALLEENRAIVSDVPGTTRDTIEEWMDLGGWPVRLVDTAGLRETVDAVEAEGVRRSEALISQARLVLQLGDCVAPKGCEVIRIHAKCDLDRGEGLNVSAKTGEGLDALKREMVLRLETLAENAPADDDRGSSALQEALAAVEFAPSGDLVLTGNVVRTAAERLGELVGATYSADFLDNLFSRFCVGK